MIKLQDLSRELGVTDRAIQKHIKKHENELQGHFERKGKNGTWLDEFAQEFIKGLMLQQPVVVADAGLQAEIERLKAQNDFLKDKLLETQDKLLGFQELLVEAKTTQLLLDAANNKTEELEKKLLAAESALAAEKEKKITFKEFWRRR